MGDGVDRTKVPFDVAEGKPLFPAYVQYGQLDQRIRNNLWNTFYLALNSCVHVSDNSIEESFFFVDSPFYEILLLEHMNNSYLNIEEWPSRYKSKESIFRKYRILFLNEDYLRVFRFLTYIIRDKIFPKRTIESFADALDQPYSPYRLDVATRTIFPVVDPEHAETLKRDIAEVHASPWAGAKTHLRSAIDHMNAARHRDVVRESITAVESAAKEFAGDPNADLGKALRQLDDGKAHRALRAAFEKLYGYASNAKGVRHALVFGENESVGFAEAIFFLSACTAFIAYLKVKSADAGPASPIAVGEAQT